MPTPHYQADYGIYTVSDENFFAGTVASINALRYYGYTGPFAVIDIGFLPWMRDYLASLPRVSVLDIEPVKKNVRFTDELTDESPVMKGWAYKAFSILHYNLFRCWTFIDADYQPLSNIEAVLRPLAEAGQFVSTEDGANDWDQRHEDAIGVKPGKYMNINAGFITLNMDVHGSIVHEWRDLMTRRKPFDLWYGDQGALNAILDKWGVEKHVLDKVLWNQTWLNKRMAEENKCVLIEDDPANVHVFYEPKGARIMGWHGAGWDKLWHQIGIDHYRKDNEADRLKFYQECQGKSPLPVVGIFERFLFLDRFHKPLTRNGHLLQYELSPPKETSLSELAFFHRSDKCPEIDHSYTALYDLILRDIKESATSIGEMGVGNQELMGGIANYKIGASLFMWRDYFSKATIHGFDILKSSMFKDVRIETHLTDASIEASLRDSLAKGAPYDLLVDDGSHQLEHQLLFRRVASDFLKPNGFLIIEDVYEHDVDKVAATFGGCSLLYVHRGTKGYLDNFVCFVKQP